MVGDEDHGPLLDPDRDPLRGRLRPVLPLLQRLPLSESKAPLLVVVTGPPASGKTTIAREIGHTYHLPVVTKDDVKELLFEGLGRSDREWSRRLGRAAFALLYYFVERQLEARRPIVVEGNFEPTHANPAFGAIYERLPFRALQIYCTGATDFLLRTYSQRDRHPGHLDESTVDEVRAGLEEERWAPLALPGTTIVVETDIEPTAARANEAVAAELQSA